MPTGRPNGRFERIGDRGGVDGKGFCDALAGENHIQGRVDSEFGKRDMSSYPSQDQACFVAPTARSSRHERPACGPDSRPGSNHELWRYVRARKTALILLIVEGLRPLELRRGASTPFSLWLLASLLAVTSLRIVR